MVNILTKKERVKKSLAHQSPDITPWHMGFTSPVREKLVNYYKTEDIGQKVGNHFLELGANLKWQEIKPGFWQDAFGVVWDRTIDKDIGNVSNRVLSEKTSLGKYKFPEISPDKFDHIFEQCNKNKDRFIMFGIGFSLFERAWTLRGMENLLMDMVTDPIFVETLLDRILDFNIALVREAKKFNIDCIHFGDDWGQQHGLIMGPKHWQHYIKPRIAKMYKEVKQEGLFVAIHSCGDIKELIPDLIEIGLDILNPFQPEVMNVYEIKKKYGNKLSFWGGVSTQKTLPYGTPRDVQDEVKQLIQGIGKDGGYILAPAHSVPKDVPLENVLALIETVQNQ